MRRCLLVVMQLIKRQGLHAPRVWSGRAIVGPESTFLLRGDPSVKLLKIPEIYLWSLVFFSEYFCLALDRVY